ncbi:uncharacterized protein N7477_005381 [Penicillium maclennaniae]|uniref:uncharacterized protein n=1 Tax=Penicillium maclennaniae TaxID=1343394 RepID=UPI00254132A6|nr:uncharacterized protein N7477_005381 [Penicillium maclennaniae]KAJ5670018.1 hypothetical protein N7477_005381 [Penicillium maclennaniae]
MESGLCDELTPRAANVTLKERYRLVFAHRESPLSTTYLQNMTLVTHFHYIKPSSIDGLVHHSIGCMLDLLDFGTAQFEKREA